MDRTVSLEGRGIIPCLHNAGEVHAYQGPAIAAADLINLLGRAAARQAQITIAVENLRRILVEERLLVEESPMQPFALLEEVRQTLALAQSVIPGVHQEVLTRLTRMLDRVDAYQDMQPSRGLA